MNSIVTTLLTSLPVGACAGFCAGLLGIGGGLIVVPAVAMIAHWQGYPLDRTMQIAAATSFAVMIMTTGSSAWRHTRLQTQPIWPTYRQLIPGMLLGTGLGVSFATHVHSHWLRIGFAGFLTLSGILLCRSPDVLPTAPASACLKTKLIRAVASFLIGLKSGLLGIGGGLLTVPLLRFTGRDVRYAVSVSACTSLSLAVLGLSNYLAWQLWYGQPISDIILWPVWLGVVITSPWMAHVGACLSHHWPRQRLRYVFAGFLFIIACHQVWMVFKTR